MVLPYKEFKKAFNYTETFSLLSHYDVGTLVNMYENFLRRDVSNYQEVMPWAVHYKVYESLVRLQEHGYAVDIEMKTKNDILYTQTEITLKGIWLAQTFLNVKEYFGSIKDPTFYNKYSSICEGLED